MVGEVRMRTAVWRLQPASLRAMRGSMRGPSICRREAEKIEKVVRFGAFWCIGGGSGRVFEQCACGPSVVGARFSRALFDRAFPEARCVKKIEK